MKNMSVHWLKVMMLVSMITTAVFVVSKLAFYLLTSDDWDNNDKLSQTVITAMLSAIITLVIKLIRYIPRYKHFKDVHNDKQIINLNLTNRMIRLATSMTILYVVTLAIEVYTLTKAAEYNSYILMYGVIFAIVTTPISLGITITILVFARKTKQHYTQGTI